MGTKSSEDLEKIKEVIDHQVTKTLKKQIRESSNVFLIGHERADFDAIGSCMGLYQLATSFGKKAYIIVDDEKTTRASKIKKIIDKYQDSFRFIQKEEIPNYIQSKSLLIITDTSKRNRLTIEEYLDQFPTKIILDHHDEDKNTIDTPYRFIIPQVSSSSELVARVLASSKIECTSAVATALLAGINLDTRRYKYNTTSATHDVAKRLLDREADASFVKKLFMQDFETYCRINNFIINGTVFKTFFDKSSYPYKVAFTLNRTNPHLLYDKEDYSSAANILMKLDDTVAAFTLGYIDRETVHISARSDDSVNVGLIMNQMQGGGNSNQAGTAIPTEDIFKLEEELMKTVDYEISVGYPNPEGQGIEKVKK